MKLKNFLALCLFLLFGTFHAKAQTEKDNGSKKWSLVLDAGLASSSTNSEYVSPLGYYYGIGVSKEWLSSKKLSHAVQIKVKVYKQHFSKLPYYTLNEQQELVSSTFNQVNSYPMLYVGWRPRYKLSNEKQFIQGGSGR